MVKALLPPSSFPSRNWIPLSPSSKFTQPRFPLFDTLPRPLNASMPNSIQEWMWEVNILTMKFVFVCVQLTQSYSRMGSCWVIKNGDMRAYLRSRWKWRCYCQAGVSKANSYDLMKCNSNPANACERQSITPCSTIRTHTIHLLTLAEVLWVFF